MQLENPRTVAAENAKLAAAETAKHGAAEAAKDAAAKTAKDSAVAEAVVTMPSAAESATQAALENAKLLVQESAKDAFTDLKKGAASSGSETSAKPRARDNRKGGKNRKDSGSVEKEVAASAAAAAADVAAKKIEDPNGGDVDGATAPAAPAAVLASAAALGAERPAGPPIITVVTPKPTSAPVSTPAPNSTPTPAARQHHGIDRERIKKVTDHLHFDVLNGTLDVEQAMIVLNICLKDDCSVADAIAKMGWTVGVRPFREHEISYSDSDLIDWLTQED
jgi:hypothetical protein